MESSKLSKLTKRIVTALIMIPVVIAALYLGFPYLHMVAVVIASLMAWEWAHMIPNKNAPVYSIAYTMSAVSAVIFPSALAKEAKACMKAIF